MKVEAVTQRQAASTVALFVLGSALVLGMSGKARQDAWMGVIFAMAAVLPALYVYARLLKRFPGKNLFDICVEVFGRFLGKIVVALFLWYALNLGALVFRNFSEFIEVRVFPDMPQTVSLVVMALPVIWVCRRGVEPLGRCSIIILPIVLIVVVATTLMLVKDMRPSNLTPVGEYLSETPKDALIDFSFPFAETVLFLALLNTLTQGGKPGKAWLYGVVIGGFTLLLGVLRNFLVMSGPYHAGKWFPSYDAASIIIAGRFVSRIENAVGANLLLCGFVKISVCLLAAAKGAARLFNAQDYRPYVAPVGLAMVALASILYKNIMEMFEFINVYPYYAILFQVVLPLALCVAAEIKFLVKRKKLKGGEATA